MAAGLKERRRDGAGAREFQTNNRARSVTRACARAPGRRKNIIYYVYVFSIFPPCRAPPPVCGTGDLLINDPETVIGPTERAPDINLERVPTEIIRT